MERIWGHGIVHLEGAAGQGSACVTVAGSHLIKLDWKHIYMYGALHGTGETHQMTLLNVLNLTVYSVLPQWQRPLTEVMSTL